jgi:spore germination cell wall hydrolase CwlJ-like protein
MAYARHPGVDQKQTHRQDAIPRSDRVLFVALAVILATASAALGSAMTYRPPVKPVVRTVAAPRPQSPQDMVLDQLVAEHRCLSEALYYEARGEGRTGQQAVAEVVFHRMNAGNYGHSICAVVYEGSFRPGCQFSFTCDGALHHPREASAWKEAEELAAHILTGEVRLRNATGGAINYHAAWMNPYWAPTLKKTARIGNHIFYRSGGRMRDAES